MAMQEILLLKYLFTVADHKQKDLAASKEKLQAELDTTKRVSMAKDQQISRLQEDLWTMEEKMMQKQKSKWNNDGVGVVTERTNMLQYY